MSLTAKDLKRNITQGETLEARIKACKQAGENNYVSIAPILGRLSRNKEPLLREAACESLAMMNNAKVVPHLAGYLNDRQANIRERATSALITQGKDAVPHLIELLTRSGRFTRVAAANILAELKEEQAVLPLISQLGNCDHTMVIAMSQALDKLDEPGFASVFPGIYIKEKESLETVKQLLTEGDFRFVTPLVRFLKICRHSQHHTSIHEVLHGLESAALKHGKQMYCMTHLRRFTSKKFISNLFPFQRTPYMACRVCRSTLSGRKIKAVIAHLDHTSNAMKWDENKNLLVSWFDQQDLFDFDEVRIGDATDQEIVQFCITTGNDSDKFRRKRYKTVTCRLTDKANVHPNTLRILRQTFGEVHAPSAL